MDVFHKTYRELTDEEKANIAAIKDKAQELYDLMLPLGADPRHAALARTNLEQAVMWAVKSITG